MAKATKPTRCPKADGESSGDVALYLWVMIRVGRNGSHVGLRSRLGSPRVAKTCFTTVFTVCCGKMVSVDFSKRNNSENPFRL